jgi:hypothetical protein
LQALVERPADPQLAERVWGGISIEELEDPFGPVHASAAGPAEELFADERTLFAETDPAWRASHPAVQTDERPKPAPPMPPVETPVLPSAPQAEPAAQHPPVDPPAGVAVLEDVPLRMIAAQIAQTIARRGEVTDAELVKAYESDHGIQVAQGLHRTMTRFAWSAKGHGYVEFDDKVWTPGSKEPEEDGRYGDWTLSSIVARARELRVHDSDPFDQLVNEVYSGNRVPKLTLSIVGWAIRKASQS